MQQKQRYCITTAIAYTNGDPHFGHAYEIVCADVIARFNRLAGKDVFFLTGTDEHGQKVRDSAMSFGLEPLKYCDIVVEKFKTLYAKLHISNNYFIRTTSEEHLNMCQRLWTAAAKRGDIYLGEYEGWYNTREEMFVSEKDAATSDYKDPITGKPFDKFKEPSYFFRLSKYQDKIIKHITANPDFIFPVSKRTEIMERLKEPLTDLSISRTLLDWGVPVPGDDGHVMYVWFDALTNYLSGTPPQYWPIDVHLIGKDIIWFHSVIWIGMLMSCDLPLPKQIVCHGFVNDHQGKKMAKSVGNVVDPFDVIDKYSADVLRYFVMKTGIFGADFPHSNERLAQCNDSELQANVGNLVNRILKLTEKYCNRRIPEGTTENLIDLPTLTKNVTTAFDTYRIQDGIDFVVKELRLINVWLALKEPWKEGNEKVNTIRTVLESLYIIGHFLLPIVPHSMTTMFESLNHSPVLLSELQSSNLITGKVITICEPLFPRFLENSVTRKKLKNVTV